MGNSTRKLRDVVDLAMTVPDIMPVFSSPGTSQQPALSIANRVMKDMMAPGMPWKFNRIIVPVFYTISWQQDYASPMAFSKTANVITPVGVSNVAWLEHGFLRDINNTAFPKPIATLFTRRDLERTSFQFGQPSEICWLPNDQLNYATWGGGSQGDPGPLQTITNPVGANITPSNPITQIIDANGNLLVLVQIVDNAATGATGSVPPLAAVGAAVGTQVIDGHGHGLGQPPGVIWQVVNPKGIGFRLSPLPPQAGRVWEVNVIAQAKFPVFTTMQQLLDPLPDDYASYFEEGFIAYSHEHSGNPGVRAAAPQKRAQWISSLKQALGQGDKEQDAAQIYPDRGIMDSQTATDIGPAYPFRR